MANYPYYNPYFYSMPQVSQPTTSIIWVSGEKEAAAYPVAPNNAVALWDNESPAIYLKQADASGKASMKVYDLIEREAAGTETDDFATRSDIKTVKKMLENLKIDLDSLKMDVYGMAGKKRKKGEEDE